eukprot:GHUV01018452.1.p1 GENE.GHUV01018452.1~~GHUV01018452.1.p1  ORF type:complete len:146 (+),score=5.23 GHUV01018452.1:2330-2767(+)
MGYMNLLHPKLRCVLAVPAFFRYPAGYRRRDAFAAPVCLHSQLFVSCCLSWCTGGGGHRKLKHSRLHCVLILHDATQAWQYPVLKVFLSLTCCAASPAVLLCLVGQLRVITAAHTAVAGYNLFLCLISCINSYCSVGGLFTPSGA